MSQGCSCSEWEGCCFVQNELSFTLQCHCHPTYIQRMYKFYFLPVLFFFVCVVVAYVNFTIAFIMCWPAANFVMLWNCFFFFFYVYLVKLLPLPVLTWRILYIIVASWLSFIFGSLYDTLGQLVNSACLLLGPQRRLCWSMHQIHESKWVILLYILLYNYIILT